LKRKSSVKIVEYLKASKKALRKKGFFLLLFVIPIKRKDNETRWIPACAGKTIWKVLV
jgi:hypothetical protein